MNFQTVLQKYRAIAFSERDKGTRFERLMQAYLRTEPKYQAILKTVWMWNEFPLRAEFGGKDLGIDLVAQTFNGDFWAVQCKCFDEGTYIDKAAVDTFLTTSGKYFSDENMRKTSFSQRLWISTTNHWSSEAEHTLQNQNPPVSRINLYDLENAYVDWVKLDEGIYGTKAALKQRDTLDHQKKAIEFFNEHFKTADRGRLIMACGTGKTFTSLKIAENETDSKGLILFLVPSIALLGQALNEWAAFASKPVKPICICSDAEITKKRKENDEGGFTVEDLALPASTDIKTIIHQFTAAKNNPNDGMTVVFSTYQSIERVSEAQHELNKQNPDSCIFDIVICDEAHRTTGVSLRREKGDYDESAFVRVHDPEFIHAKKRIYMTATPRLYDLNEETKAKVRDNDVYLCSMDDVALYGEEVYRIGFGEAVSKDLLSDYKVLVLTLHEKQVPSAFQDVISDTKNEIKSDDISKLIGCINALSKRMLIDADLILEADPAPMRKAVAFCRRIKDSQHITNIFNSEKDVYYNTLSPEDREALVTVESQHIDGTMGAAMREEKLNWLKSTPDSSKECRILTNVRCLSEGVDVPSLDAVLFLSAQKSEIDIVQSVGRVMRKASGTGKKYGYIIIPVIIPSTIEPEEALDKSDCFDIVWKVLNALRAHDDRFNAKINKIDLNKTKPENIIVTSIGSPDGGTGDSDSSSGMNAVTKEVQQELALKFESLQSIIFARMVKKVGTRRYWELWAKDIASVAEKHVERISKLVSHDGPHKDAFDQFLIGLHKNLNPSVSAQEAVEMLAQHIITKPVFEALFENYSFVQNNPVSISMQNMINLLHEEIPSREAELLANFYKSIKNRCDGIDNAEGKQKVIIELYDKFFKAAFPKVVEKLGIVYTPVEVVDFIIHSVADVLKKEFDRDISDENVHILDPFTGTGTFITRLLQSGLIKHNDLQRKYLQELHANEIVLLAYYIASINIENVYHDLIGHDKGYKAFDGICLTDTFQLGESDDNDKLFSEMFSQNSKRVIAQKKAPIRVIIGNPPYSVGQKSANDNAQNQDYPLLDSRIENTYAKESSASLSKALYDAYIKAFRWSSDRIDPKNGGIIAFVSNSGWLDGNATDGFRKCLENEFSSIYVFNLRGNQRTSGDLSRKEGGKIFGSGSRTPISITLLVKNPSVKKDKATIFYHDIGDYLPREEKLKIAKDFKTILNPAMKLQTLTTDKNGDWLNKCDDTFITFIPVEPQEKFDSESKTFFTTHAIGIATNRDAWVYNYSAEKLEANISHLIAFYNQQREGYSLALENDKNVSVEDFISTDPTKISWTVNLKNDIKRNTHISYISEKIIIGNYRPFCSQLLYLDKNLIERPGLCKKFFPTPSHKNLVICVSGVGASKEFSSLMTDCVPDLQVLFNGQCFPLYYYEKIDAEQMNLFDQGKGEYIRRDAVSDFIHERAREMYGPKTTKEDVFYYVYGLLHSPEYRTRFSADLKKMLPRIPLVDEPKDFKAFSKAGRALAELHLNYETHPAWESVLVKGAESGHYHVEKMKFAKMYNAETKKNEDDKHKIHFNSHITIENIPSEAYEYVVNGKSAIEWIMERYQVTVNKESQIRNDPNDWAKEHNQPRYILDLLLSIITLSMKTMETVKTLPPLKLDK